MRSLTLKLTLAFLGVSLTGIALVAALVWGITAAEFNRFLLDRGMDRFTAAATKYYETNGSWDGIEEVLRDEGFYIDQDLGTGQGAGQTAGQAAYQNPMLSKNPPQPPFMLVDPDGKIIASGERLRSGELSRVGTNYPLTKDNEVGEISVNGEVVGYVVTTGGAARPDPFEERYRTRTNQALLLAALGGSIIAVLLGLVLARTITRPVRELTLATSAMAHGQLNQQVPVRSKDELGELTKSFNTMSADLERANNLRKQMTADIAHDLRTPLSVITGYLEGLKDGVVKPSPKRFAAMYDEAIFLQRLVEDLRTLSLADAGELSINPQTIQPDQLIQRLADSFQHRAEQNQIHLETVIAEELPSFQADPARMLQALGNLVGNAIRFTPPEGEITLIARQDDDSILLGVKDSGTGISAEVLPHIFDRFYRGDESRFDGGSGLGLAIAKSIIELQGGKIAAASGGDGQGSEFTVRMPL